MNKILRRLEEPIPRLVSVTILAPMLEVRSETETYRSMSCDSYMYRTMTPGQNDSGFLFLSCSELPAQFAGDMSRNSDAKTQICFAPSVSGIVQLLGLDFLQQMWGPLQYSICQDPPSVLTFASSVKLDYGIKKRIRTHLCDCRNYFPSVSPLASQTEVKMIWEQGLSRLIFQLNDYGLGVIRTTAAGLGWHAMRRWLPEDKVLVVNREPQVLTAEAASYHGVTTEALRLGQFCGEYYHIDLNGAFGAAMQESKLPLKLEISYVPAGAATADDNRHMLKHLSYDHWLLGEVSGPLPSGLDLEAARPTAHGTYWLAHDDLMSASFESRDPPRLLRLLVYSHGKILSEIVDKLWTCRYLEQRAGNRLLSEAYKMMIVGLYGRFAQRVPCYQPVTGIHAEEEFGPWVTIDVDPVMEIRSHTCNGRKVMRENGRQYSYYAIPRIASAIAAKVRRRMKRLQQTAGAKHCYLRIVDSLIVDEAGLRNISDAHDIRSDTLGALRVVAQGKGLTVRSATDYTLGQRRVICGIPQNAKKISEGRYAFWVSQGTQRAMNDLCHGEIIQELRSVTIDS